MRAFLVLLLLVGSSHADEKLPVRKGRVVLQSGLAIDVHAAGWRLRRAQATATVIDTENYLHAPASILRASLTAGGHTLTLAYQEYGSEGGKDSTIRAFPVQELEARIDRAAGLLREKAHDVPGAITFYDRACIAMPELVRPCIDAAATQATDEKAAVAALARSASVEPLATYYEAVGDPRLAGYLDKQPLLGLRAPQQGTARYSDGVLGYSAKYDAIVVRGNHLMVYRARTGQLLARVRLDGNPSDFGVMEPDGTDDDSCETDEHSAACRKLRAAERKARRAQRALHASVDVWLRDLGFSSPPDAELGVEDDGTRPCGELHQVHFARNGVRLSAQDGIYRVRRDGRVIAELDERDDHAGLVAWAWMSPQIGLVVVGTDPCAGSDDFPHEHPVVVLPLHD